MLLFLLFLKCIDLKILRKEEEEEEEKKSEINLLNV